MNLTNKILFILFISCTGNVFGQVHTVVYDGRKECVYETKQGRMEGKYTAYYSDGKKMAEGQFESNYPIGKWTVWDQMGRKQVVRYYENPFVYKRIFPAVPNEGPIPLLCQPVYNLKYNADGYIDYCYVEGGDIEWQKRIWRTITPENNPLLFDDNRFFKLLCDNILNGNVVVYQDEKYKMKYTPSEMQEKIEIPPGHTVISYKIKEDKFLERQRFVGEYRIISICPVLVSNRTGDTTDLGWIYFPQLRKYLAQEKLTVKGLPPNIKTYDDLFFFRYFASDIYKESNIYDRKITDYTGNKDAIKKEAERIQMQCIQKELYFWLSYSN